MKNVHLVIEAPFTPKSDRRNLRKVDGFATHNYFEYLLIDGTLFIGDNSGDTESMEVGKAHKEIRTKREITSVNDLPTKLDGGEALFKWENDTRIRCTIEEAKVYLEKP